MVDFLRLADASNGARAGRVDRLAQCVRIAQNARGEALDAGVTGLFPELLGAGELVLGLGPEQAARETITAKETAPIRKIMVFQPPARLNTKRNTNRLGSCQWAATAPGFALNLTLDERGEINRNPRSVRIGSDGVI